MKKIITATLLCGAIICSLFFSASANAETAGQHNAVKKARGVGIAFSATLGLEVLFGICCSSPRPMHSPVL